MERLLGARQIIAAAAEVIVEVVMKLHELLATGLLCHWDYFALRSIRFQLVITSARLEMRQLELLLVFVWKQTVHRHLCQFHRKHRCSSAALPCRLALPSVTMC